MTRFLVRKLSCWMLCVLVLIQMVLNSDSAYAYPTKLSLQELQHAAATTAGVSAPMAQPRLLGFADIHNHQMANLAFGGQSIVGSAYGPIEDALNPSLDRQYHKPFHVGDILGNALATRRATQFYYSNEGYPDFSGWPNFWEVSHQKVYQDWLYHAVVGGLRLMVMFAEDSPALCKLSNNDGRNCDDEDTTILLQLDAAYAMQDYIDQQAGGSGKGWYRIVTTPTEARRVIQEGKLAVVLGIETAHLFNCQSDQPCGWLDHLKFFWQQKGVRHFFPIHQANNAFGGASYFNSILQRQRNWVGDLWKGPVSPYDLYTHPCPEYEFAGGRCNDLGLTELGHQLITELMRSGSLIDVDHMSDRSFADTISITQQYTYPVVASHAGFNEINHSGQSHEGQLTPTELQQIHNLGGMIGLITGQGDLQDVATYRRPEGKHTINHVCGRTTETFAQAYYYALDHAPGMSIALGTDFNSPLAEPGPRFGSGQCFVYPGENYSNRDSSQQKWGGQLNYRFLARGSLTELDRYTSGNRTFDFNYDGLAHVGLLPDFLADLEALGMSAEELDPMFHSAEGYIEMWERAIAASHNLPRRIDGYALPGTLPSDVRVSFTIQAVDRYSGESINADVYLNDVLVGRTGEIIEQTFHSVRRRVCEFDPEFHRRVCEEFQQAPDVRVKLSGSNSIDTGFLLQIANPGE